MSITNTDNVFPVNESEYGYAAGGFKPVAGGGSVPMTIPKLMGAMIAPGTETIIINNLFDNAKECKPVYATKVTKAKTVAVKVKENCNWLDKLNGAGMVPAGSMFTIEFLNGNIQTPVMTTK